MGRNPSNNSTIGMKRSVKNEINSSGTRSGNLTNQQRKELCEFYLRNNEKITQRELALWAKNTFRLAKEPGQSTISDIIRKKHIYLNMHAVDLVVKRRRSIKNPALDQALVNWILHCEQRQISLTGENIKTKAKALANELHIPTADQPEFSTGWLQAFQERYNLKSYRLKSRQNNTGTSSATNIGLELFVFDRLEQDTEELQALKSLLKNYEPSNVFSLVETGLFYALDPSRSLSFTTPSSRPHVAIALAASADGSQRLLPLIMGSQPLHQTLETKFHDGQYRTTPKGTMTALIFQQWLEQFNTQRRQMNQPALLLIAKGVSSYILSGLLLSHIQVQFVSSKILNELTHTSVSCLKNEYRLLHLYYAMDRKEEQEEEESEKTKEIYAIGLEHVLEWIQQIWYELPSNVLMDGWQLLFEQLNTTSSQVILDTYTHQLEEEISKQIQVLQVRDAMTLIEMEELEAKSITLHEIIIEKELISTNNGTYETNESNEKSTVSSAVIGAPPFVSEEKPISYPNLSTKEELESLRKAYWIISTTTSKISSSKLLKEFRKFQTEKRLEKLRKHVLNVCDV
jgi:hypothetical protein